MKALFGIAAAWNIHLFIRGEVKRSAIGKINEWAPGRELRRALSPVALGGFCAGVVVMAAYLLSQADAGIRDDALIYMGRVLADLDPQGVGRDPMFVLDGQSAFTAFGAVARAGVRAFGLTGTVRLLDLSAAAVWAASMLNLIRQLRLGRYLAFVAGAALLLPRWYTPMNGMAAGEALAIPRPFAEALVLFSFSMILKRRYGFSILLLGGAAALHPIMAAPGFAILVLFLAAEDRRWATVTVGLTLGLMLAGSVGAPVLSRLFVVMDPAWLRILETRNSTLFVTRWTTDGLLVGFLQTSTVILAGALVEDPLRKLLRSVVAVAALGFVLSAVCCDTFHLLLFVQAQAWRALWLLAAIAPMAAGICFWQLWDDGVVGRMASISLAAAWAAFQLEPLGAICAVLAVAIFLSRHRLVTARLAPLIYAAGGAVILFAVVIGVTTFLRSPGKEAMPVATMWRLIMPFLPILAFGLLHVRHASWIYAASSAVLAMALLVVLTLRYDDRHDLQNNLDSARAKKDLVEMLAARRGEVLWLGGDELWFWARRANWNTSIQGAGLVFSRTLATTWYDRARTLVDLGLASPAYLDPWGSAAIAPRRLDGRRIMDELCSRADAPAWIVLPVAADARNILGADVLTWTAPIKDQRIVSADGASVWIARKRLIAPCSGEDGRKQF